MTVISVDEIRRRVETAESAVSRRLGQRDQVAKQLSEAEQGIARAKEEVKDEEVTQDILIKASALSWERTKGRIESLVDRALRAVFPDRDYRFVIEQETKRGASSINFLLREGDLEIDLWEEGGLGVADVIGFALRSAYLVLHRPQVRPILFWDEPFCALAPDYIPNISRFVRQVVKELGIKAVMVTHIPEFASEADEVFRIEKVGDKCTLTPQTIGRG